ncbi:MAG: hypothetical protein RBU23_11235 [Candidatus Auribacterota bacterium]|jgi:hypothetical protein|nr:hypothetical protein [Candidatus Auribacterota bacterium]
MMRESVFSLVLLMVLIAGCSNPWYPYPYINPQVTDKARQGEPKQNVNRDIPAPVQTESVDTSDVPESTGENDMVIPILDEPNFPDEPGTMKGQVPAPYSK